MKPCCEAGFFFSITKIETMRTLSIVVFLLISPCANAQQENNGGYPTFIEMGGAYNFYSNILGENRVLNIYLPANYHTNDSVNYPVIYLLDGSLNEDYFHIAGLLQFTSSEWVNMMPPSILVGIGNVDRKRDFTFPTSIQQDKIDFPTTGGSANFIRFLEEELQTICE
jgi:predicted alpha/beta superfamily hydrolase